MSNGYFFNGHRYVTPTIQSRVVDGGMMSLNSPVGNTLCIIGSSDAGIPKTPIYLSSPGQAAEVLRGGELLKAVQLAFAPSTQTNAPQTIIAMRVNPATQSTGVLKDSAVAAVINITSTDYGLFTNQIKVMIETGTTKGKRVSTKLNDVYYTNDNTFRDAFTVSYIGANATATMAISNTEVTLVDSITTTIDLTAFKTVRDVVDRINSNPNYVAASVSGSELTLALNGLDTLAATSIKAVTVTATANLQAIVDWINAKDFLINATRVASAGTVPANTVGWLNITGGTNGVTLTQQWFDCLAALQAEDVQWIVPLSSLPAVWSMTDGHCQYMSTSGKAERRAFVGSTSGVTSAVALTDAFAINSDRTAYCYPGIYDYNAGGDLTLYPAYMTAAILGGSFAGINPGETMTNKSIRVAGVEYPLSTPAETDPLILGGVLSVSKDKTKGIKVVQAISTWLINSAANRTEISTGTAADYVSRTIREMLNVYIGRKGSPYTIAEAKAAVDSALRILARPEPLGLSILVGDPGFKNVTARIDGDALIVDFEASIVTPLNFIFISIHANQYRSTLAA